MKPSGLTPTRTPARIPTRTPTRTLALCADDFGLAPGISAGIARLAQAQRLSAISCITNSKHWETSAPLLATLPASVEAGLHINLTEGRPLSPRLAALWPRLPALPVLIARSHLGLLPRAELRSEVHAQLAAFRAATGAAPKFVDGHQHVHHLPVLRAIILDMVEHVQPLPALRNTGRVLGPGAGAKRWLIENSGGRALARELAQRVLLHNPALLGAYDFVDPNYRALMQAWLAELPHEGGLLFCHPGAAVAGDPPDAIAAARGRELAYLGSDAFMQDLAAAKVTLGRVWQTGTAPAATR
jgi:chitin disaccharide deacetylase